MYNEAAEVPQDNISFTLFIFSSYVTARFERRKQGVKLNVKNENCPPGEKKGRRKSEG